MYIPPEKLSLPQFLEQNKDICLSIQQYARENLHKLSIEFLREYLHDVFLPKMVKESYMLKPNSEGYEQSLLELLKKYNLTCISPSMIATWMEKLGFKYEQWKKGYYIDGHENPATVEYRKAFVQQYLTYESRVHHRIQITKEESK